MRKLCLLLLILFAVAEGSWEEKNWWWDELWEEEFEVVEPDEPVETEPTGRKHQLIGFDLNWRSDKLVWLGKGEEGTRKYPWQPKEDYHYRKIGTETEVAVLRLGGTQTLSLLAKQENRTFPYRQSGNFSEGDHGLLLAHKSENFPVNLAWRVGKGGKTFVTQTRYNSETLGRGLELWGKGKLWQFKIHWEQLEKIFPLWQAQSYFRDGITYSASFRQTKGFRLHLKGEAWQREYPLGVMLTSRKKMWEIKLEGPIRLWNTELSYLSRLQRYPYQSAYDYFLTRGKLGFSKNFSPTRQLFIGFTQTGQAYFQQTKSFQERSMAFRWQERLGPLELIVRCEFGERLDEPNPFLVQVGVEQKYE